MDNTVVINDYRQMDKVIKEGRTYLLNICKKIKKSGCNVLLIQKSILRDAVDDTSLTFLKRLNILAVKDVERDEIDFLTKSLGCKPVADIEAFTEDKLGYADLVEETNNDGTKVVKITGVKNRGRTVSILAMSSNQLVLDECERSIHDALCVVRCLVKKRCVDEWKRRPTHTTSLTRSPPQRANRWRWRTRDPRIAHAVAIRTGLDRHGGILLPSVRRCARGHSDNARRECRAQPDRDRHRASQSSRPRRAQRWHQRSEGPSPLSCLYA